jgi:hypothetical protein
MKLIRQTVIALLASFALLHAVQAADATSVRAILITASNAKAPSDPRLAAYEAELQRNVPESSFRLVGEGSASVSPGSRASIRLGGAHRLDVEGEKDGSRLGLKVQWLNGRTLVLSTTLTNLQPGVPTLLGRRPSGDGEVPIVLVIAK